VLSVLSFPRGWKHQVAEANRGGLDKFDRAAERRLVRIFVQRKTVRTQPLRAALENDKTTFVLQLLNRSPAYYFVYGFPSQRIGLG
jgi:hypothetical protein